MKRNLRRMVWALPLALAFVAPGFAASMSAAQGSPTKAQAAVDFRIVIPETLHLRSRAEKIGRVRRFVSQTTELVAGRVVVTVAKP